jgi:hypothetical protein
VYPSALSSAKDGSQFSDVRVMPSGTKRRLFISAATSMPRPFSGAPQPHEKREHARAAGSMDTTIQDWSRFLAAVTRGDLLGGKRRRLMQASDLAMRSGGASSSRTLARRSSRTSSRPHGGGV